MRAGPALHGISTEREEVKPDSRRPQSKACCSPVVVFEFAHRRKSCKHGEFREGKGEAARGGVAPFLATSVAREKSDSFFVVVSLLCYLQTWLHVVLIVLFLFMALKWLPKR